MEETELFERMLGCSIAQHPVTCLDIPLHYSTIRVKNWSFLLKKIEKALMLEEKGIIFSRMPHPY